MKIFVSWSGDNCKKIADHLKEWIQDTFDNTYVWFSEKDIDRGDEWNHSIRKQLAATHFGIICVTDHSVDRPWVLFEAGAISKQLDKACVIPLLLALTEKKWEPPLAMFESAYPNKDGMQGLFWSFYKKKRRIRAKRQSKEFIAVFEKSWEKHGNKFLEKVEKLASTKCKPKAVHDEEFALEKKYQS